jgi:hypothetical protein
MSELVPKIAAQLATEVYQVQRELDAKIFLARPEFSQKAGNATKLKATVGFRLINTQDGFGICASGGVNYENDLFIIFRGSTTANHGADWASNARVGVEISKTGLPVHVGFNSIFCSMLPSIQEFLASQSKATGTIHCIGHSLGGAVASLAADWISSNRPNPVSLYTFGAPRSGLSRFAKRLTAKISVHRVFHATDPVPMIPIFPFVHAPLPGVGHFVPSSEAIVSAAAHDIRKYTQSVSEMSWEKLSGRAPLYNVESAIEHWLKSKIPVDTANPKIWDWLNAALIYVLKKIGIGLFATIETGLTGVDTIADKIAWILRKGIDLSKDASGWVMHLLRKIMQAVGMKVAEKAADLTNALLKSALLQLMTKMTAEAQRAIRQVFRN